MKVNFKTRILGACTTFLLIFGVIILKEYMANHTYYYDMLKNNNNIYIIIATLICAALPLIYGIYRKGASIKGFARCTWIGLLLYGILYASIRENILGTGAIMRAVNSFIIFGLSLFMLVAFTSIGAKLYTHRYKKHDRDRRSLLLTFGLGFSSFVLINYILILAHVYYPIINRIQIIALGFLIRKSKSQLSEIAKFLNNQLKTLTIGKGYTNTQRTIALLLLISLAYYFIGFKLAYIPYPTARDANHAYMLMPNFISGSFGRNRNTEGTGYFPVYLSFVSFFFSIIKGLGAGFWISPDSFGVEMNYLTALFTFITTLGIIDKVLSIVSSKNESQKSLSLTLGWFSKLLWLTSGMGAFLVFVDNKSDFGVMYLSCLGLFSGLGYIDYIVKKYNQNNSDDIDTQEGHNDLYLSAIFFALAVTSKVTALFDAMNFILLIIGLVLGGLVLVGLGFIIMGALTYLGLNGVANFISKPFANIAGFGGGTLITLLGLAKGQHKFSYSYRPRLIGIVKQILIWSVIFVLSIVVLKLPIGLYRYYHDQTDIKKLPQELILGKNNTQKPSCGSHGWVLLASTNTSQLHIEQCNLSAVGVSNTKDLYKNLLTAPGDGYNEDVGRYVGFGQKDFNNPWRGFLIPEKACFSINKGASILCKNQDLISKLNKDSINTLMTLVHKDSDVYNLITTIQSGFSDSNKLTTFTSDSQKLLTDYRKDKVITKESTKVYIPYKVITPLNVTFNRSLQNLSSYYTDIGIIWLFLQFFIVLGFLYGLYSNNRMMRVTNLVAVIGWLLWIAIGGGIVWYGIGLITWTIMGFILFIHDLYIPDSDKEKHEVNHFLYYLFVGIFIIFGIIQLSLNFVRIASQGGSGPFLQYNYSNGQELRIDENLQQNVAVKFPYTWKDILNLQFPHYNKVLQSINAQTGNEVNLIAGTYAQYRINDQSKLIGDGFLSNLWTNLSDRNTCASYLRLKDKQYKYMIIDPNIASIVMGGGNSSLMDRFFAKIDPSSGKIVTDGTLTMLGKMVNDGYLDIYSTNNLGAKYGFGLSSNELTQAFGITNDDDIAMLRARLATVRFWGNQQQLIAGLSQLFTQRVANGKAISDIADVYGKVIDEHKLDAIVQKAIQQGFPSIQNSIKDLSQDERFVLLNYLNIFSSYNKQPAQFGSIATNIINQSLGGGSQLIVFEVK